MGHANLLRIVSILSDVSNGAKVYRFNLDALVESRIQDRQRKIFSHVIFGKNHFSSIG